MGRDGDLPLHSLMARVPGAAPAGAPSMRAAIPVRRILRIAVTSKESRVNFPH
jgi:hypothetical protein